MNFVGLPVAPFTAAAALFAIVSAALPITVASAFFPFFIDIPGESKCLPFIDMDSASEPSIESGLNAFVNPYLFISCMVTCFPIKEIPAGDARNANILLTSAPRRLNFLAAFAV